MREAVRFAEYAEQLRAVWGLGFALCFLASLRPAWLRGAACGGLVLASSKLLVVFPENSNHFFLEYLCLVFASLVCWQRDADLLVFVKGVRWLPVLVLFWSGMNKLVYGTYFNGAYLGSILPHSGFASVFGLLMSAEELETLLTVTSPGPYAFRAPMALVASNLVYLGELASAAMLLVPRLRMLGALLGLAVLIGIELGARELLFGTLMANMLAFFAPASWSRRLLPASAGFYALLVAMAWGWLPGWSFN